jgi:FMN phosphatase YigB (HAD superfamily)
MLVGETAEYEIVQVGELQRRISECRDRVALFDNSDFIQSLQLIFDSALSAADTVLSLDVFDTLLVRDNSSELSRFYEIGAEMSGACGRAGQQVLAIDAFLARQMGTKATYRASRKVMGAREGSLAEIHLTASRLLKLDDSWAEKFVECEIAYEATKITVNPFILKCVESFKARGGIVILLSDMYFHAEHIRMLLSELDLNERFFDHIYSSGDEKISKASGLIFGKIEKDLGRRDFFHVGDSFRSDYVNPRRAGWGALHLPISASDLTARQASHDNAFDLIKRTHGITADVARPT